MLNLLGQAFAQYELTALLDQDGFTALYQARITPLSKDVLLRVLLYREQTVVLDLAAGFAEMAKRIAACKHPRMAPLIDFGRTGNFGYLVSDLSPKVLEDRLGRLDRPAPANMTDLFELSDVV